ncbi:hypothetical protein [Saccharomonospora sp.]|uniref:hypothetical protein n=1 Tax=Saccharomonospora sp. TaxID=33913 RepID=UPI00261CED9D|nr:hypothetical protein [Saccharomonospora sp.]
MTSQSEVVDAEVATEETVVEDVLGRLIERGYRFVHPRDAEGDIVTVVGVRAHGSVVDVVRLDAEDEVTAMRMPEGESDVLSPATVLWRKDGGMCEVVDALLDLPDAPGPQPSGQDFTARGCWIHSDRGQARWLRATA